MCQRHSPPLQSCALFFFILYGSFSLVQIFLLPREHRLRAADCGHHGYKFLQPCVKAYPEKEL
jgi:hypothetical protein